MSTIAALDNEQSSNVFNRCLGEVLRRIIAIQEKSAPPTEAKEANRKCEREFPTLHGAELVKSAVQDDLTFGQWHFEPSRSGNVGCREKPKRCLPARFLAAREREAAGSPPLEGC